MKSSDKEKMKFFKPKDYQKRAQEIFERLEKQLNSLLPDAQIEHVGSSAINEAISKGDLDVFVGVNGEHFEKAVLKLEKLGFSVKQGTHRDDSLCMLKSPDYSIDVAVQVVARGSKYEFFLTFRDILNRNKQLVSLYNKLKIQMEGQPQSEYRKKKSEFISKILQEA